MCKIRPWTDSCDVFYVFFLRVYPGTTQDVGHSHPMFVGGLCGAHHKMFLEWYLTFEEGVQSYCSICCMGKQTILCDGSDCNRYIYIVQLYHKHSKSISIGKVWPLVARSHLIYGSKAEFNTFCAGLSGDPHSPFISGRF